MPKMPWPLRSIRPAINVFDRVGPDRVIALARRLGISTELTRLRPLSLGASCVIPLELAAAYGTLVNGGRSVQPIFVKRIEARGKVLFDQTSVFDPMLPPGRRLDRMVAHLTSSTEEPALDPQSAFMMSSMLRDVVTRGTGVPARSLPWPAAGKTGTTNKNTDAWFVGFTGRVVAAVWLGHDDPSKVLGRRQDGGRAALPLWMKLVRLAEKGRSPVDLPGPEPEGLVRTAVDRETGLLARPGAGGSAELYFRAGTEPTEVAGHSSGGDVARDAHSF